jgi:hypothetical protein
MHPTVLAMLIAYLTERRTKARPPLRRPALPVPIPAGSPIEPPAPPSGLLALDDARARHVLWYRELGRRWIAVLSAASADEAWTLLDAPIGAAGPSVRECIETTCGISSWVVRPWGITPEPSAGRYVPN